MNTSNISLRLLSLIASVGSFFFLFYRAPEPGLNWFIYALIASILAYYAYKPELKAGYLLPAIGVVISGFSVYFNGSNLAIVATLLSFGYLGMSVVAPRLEPGLGMLMGIMNYLMSPFAVLIRFFQGLGKQDKSFKRVIGVLVIPSILLIIFGALYYQSSTAFKELVDLISWDRLPAILFTLLVGLFVSAVLLYAFIPEYTKQHMLSDAKSKELVETMGGKNLSTSWFIGVWTVIILLALVIILDIQQGKSTATYQTYSSHLHQSVYSSIVSIVFAAVLAILTTNYLSEESKSKFKIANTIFLGLNLVFVGLNVWHNSAYIADFGLTEKRLIIYYYLFLAASGILVTVYSVYRDKSLRYLYRANAFIVYGTVALLTTINWHRFIASYNLSHPYGKNQLVDYDYLLSLDYSVAPLLLTYEDDMNPSQQERLSHRIDRCERDRYRHDDFRSTCVEVNKINNEIKAYYSNKSKK